jgi:hypothetical protein
MMKQYGLISGRSRAQLINWSNVGGPAVMNDALLSGSADFISAGPPLSFYGIAPKAMPVSKALRQWVRCRCI